MSWTRWRTTSAKRATAIRIEAERRLSERFKLEVESRLFLRTREDDVLRSFARDDFAVVRLSWFF